MVVYKNEEKEKEINFFSLFVCGNINLTRQLTTEARDYVGSSYAQFLDRLAMIISELLKHCSTEIFD